MNIFIKFYIIISTLIGLNSSVFVYIKIDKSGLKSEPKNIEGKDGQFLVKLAKKTENGGWEIDKDNKNVSTRPDDFVPLFMPKKWEDLWDHHFIMNKQFSLAVKVEMAENKSVINFLNPTIQFLHFLIFP